MSRSAKIWLFGAVVGLTSLVVISRTVFDGKQETPHIRGFVQRDASTKESALIDPLLVGDASGVISRNPKRTAMNRRKNRERRLSPPINKSGSTNSGSSGGSGGSSGGSDSNTSSSSSGGSSGGNSGSSEGGTSGNTSGGVSGGGTGSTSGSSSGDNSASTGGNSSSGGSSAGSPESITGDNSQSSLTTRKTALPAAIWLITILLICRYLFTRKKKGNGDLEERLVQSETEQSQSEHWMVPVSKDDGLPSEKGEMMKPVWLAPATFPAADEEMSPSKTDSRVRSQRKETVMLVVVPKPAPVTEIEMTPRNGDTEGIPKSIFPDLLNTSKDKNENSATKSDQLLTGSQHSVRSIETFKVEEFSPGLWVVPLSAESVASSISESMHSADSGTLEDEDMSRRKASNSPKSDDKEEQGRITEISNVTMNGPMEDEEEVGGRKLSYPKKNNVNDLSDSSTATDTSSISSLDGDRSIGSMEGEI
ncbi:hypothetical protein IV203_037335 [Nitzschia inconspicua]|uniref:Uncharacterized protein n=1 Tax=Nitzschia inconspicua TaxID=303405 RepID=A0A9K3LKT8_9STRA|nr:hypothetical protein IV203_006291 [Nitzschia inconspicua]KAG7364133.1 hypothetical protein IV203_037335 [Nitzschia inconspicua]